ncbi:MAG: hypothetical protein ACRC4M_02940 [Mycoplasma sp.]
MWFKKKSKSGDVEGSEYLNKNGPKDSDFSFVQYEKLKFNQFLTDDKFYNDNVSASNINVHPMDKLQKKNVKTKLYDQYMKDEKALKEINQNLTLEWDMVEKTNLVLPEILDEIKHNHNPSYTKRYEHEVSNETQKFLQNQQTKLLDLDDVNKMISSMDTITKEFQVAFNEEKNKVTPINEIPTIETIRREKINPSQNKPEIPNSFPSQTKQFKTIEFDKGNNIERVTSQLAPYGEGSEKYLEIDYNKLIPVSHIDTNLRIRRVDKRKV